MANLIDTSYFIAEISLPIDDIGNNLTEYITRFEPKILESCLGYDLYKDFLAGLEETVIQDKWKDLRDGVEYEVNGYTVKWPGLINTQKESLIAYYVYYQFAKLASTYNSGSGLKLSTSENSAIADYRHKQVYAYNKCLDMIGCQGETVYTGSLYNFLYENQANYENWIFTKLQKVNMFNI